MNRNCFGSLLVAAAASLLISLAATSTGLAQSVSISGGDLNLTFAAPVPGSDFSDVVDNTSCGLSWNRPSGPGNTKITARTNLSSSTATLVVEAINVSGGSSIGPATLSTSAQTLLSGLAPGDGSCDLEYTASASLTDGTATDVHMVTFTLTD